jgi:hypothetical protein
MNQKPPKSGIPDESDDRAFGIMGEDGMTANGRTNRFAGLPAPQQGRQSCEQPGDNRHARRHASAAPAFSSGYAPSLLPSIVGEQIANNWEFVHLP